MKKLLQRSIVFALIALFAVVAGYNTSKAQEGYSEVVILGQTEELIACAGEEDMNIIVSATTIYGDEPMYQWYKDGNLLPGETFHILSFENFDYTVSGTYTCEIYYNNQQYLYSNSVFTAPIPVYALSEPVIVKQPQEVVNAVVGENYNFNVKVHYRGLVPPFYKDYFQWYKYNPTTKDSVPLKDDNRFAGTASSDLTIRSLKDADICKPGEFYFVKIVGQCGTVFSNPFIIAKAPEVVFRDHPANINPCPKADVVFNANAIPPQGFTVTYKWQKNGADITDGEKYNGVNTNKLQVFAVAIEDEGQYTCIATIPEVPTSKTSNAGILKLKDIPTAAAEGETNITVKRGNEVTFKVNLTKGAEPINVKWFYKDEVIKEGLWSQFDGEKLLTVLLEDVNENQAGEYKCLIENECDKAEVVFNLTVTKWDEANSVEVIAENGYALYTCVPNPVTGSTKIRFEMPQTNNAQVNLIDQSGRQVAVIFNGIANKGMNVVEFNTSDLNVAAGVYFYTINANGFAATLPMVIAK